MKQNLKTDSVRRVAVEQLKWSEEETETFIANVAADEEANKEEAEPAEKREKRYVALAVDPDGKLKEALKDRLAFIVEMLPTDVAEDGYLDLDGGGEPREWGELEAEAILNAATRAARTNHKKKGPFTCVGDLFQVLPKKFMKEHGMTMVGKTPVAIIPVYPSELYKGQRTSKSISSDIDILE